MLTAPRGKQQHTSANCLPVKILQNIDGSGLFNTCTSPDSQHNVVPSTLLLLLLHSMMGVSSFLTWIICHEVNRKRSSI